MTRRLHVSILYYMVKYLNPFHQRTRPMQDVMAWLNRYGHFWDERLDRLTSFAEKQEKKQK